ncbi:MAG: uracil phosphoribosyltransferase [Bacteroidales bacterium]|nr:uracil phosphoribosyltransferase [Candidatus Equimonas faecalis]
MEVINLAERNSIVAAYMAQLRDKQMQQDRTRFRHNLTRIARIMAYEISQTLDYAATDVHTPLGTATINLPQNRIVVGTVLRAGLAFHDGFLQVLDGAEAGFVAAYRVEGRADAHPKAGEVEIKLDYLASPCLDSCTFILADPMLATGKSFETAHKAFLTNGTPHRLHLCAVVASQQGIDYLKERFPSPDITLWVAAIDPTLNDTSYIVPGLGDAGDLSFGSKLPQHRT